MEWMNRGGQQQGHANQPQAPGAAAPMPTKHGRGPGPMKLTSVVLLFAVAILLVAIASSFAFGDKSSSATQEKFVDKTKMQAVFLNGGQVYFGNIKTLNDSSMQVANIYYLRVNQQVQPNGTQSTSGNDISLVKLGCELHGPDDAMVINQSQVIFWENLKGDGQVAQAVKKYKDQNPNGQKCSTAADTSGTGTGTSVTPSTTTKP